jgi:hypothetical protein
MQIFITDKSGKKFWNTEVTAAFASGERANFSKRMAAIKSGKLSFIDAATAQIVEEMSGYDAVDSMSDDELLAALGV